MPVSLTDDPRAKCLNNLSRRGQHQAETKAPCQGRDFPHKVCRPWVILNLAPYQLAAYSADSARVLLFFVAWH